MEKIVVPFVDANSPECQNVPRFPVLPARQKTMSPLPYLCLTYRSDNDVSVMHHDEIHV